MMRMLSTIAALALALALALAACGGAPTVTSPEATADVSGEEGATVAPITDATMPATDATLPATDEGTAEPGVESETFPTGALPEPSATVGPVTPVVSPIPETGATPETGTTDEGAEGAMAGDSVVIVVAADPRFATLTTLLEDTGLVQQLEAAGPVTIFAPTDDAFAALPPGTLEAVSQDLMALQQILLYHVAQGAYPASEITDGATVQTLAGEDLRLNVMRGTVAVNGTAEVIEPDIMVGASVVHVIDEVLIPSSVTLPAASGG